MPQAPFTSILNTDVYSSSDVTRIPCFSRQSWITCWRDSDSDSGMSWRNRAPSGRHFFKPTMLNGKVVYVAGVVH